MLSQVSTVTGITNDGSIAGAYYLMLSSGDYIVNTGSLSGGQLIATANGNITNGDSGTMTGTSGLSLTSGGKIRNEEKPPCCQITRLPPRQSVISSMKAKSAPNTPA